MALSISGSLRKLAAIARTREPLPPPFPWRAPSIPSFARMDKPLLTLLFAVRAKRFCSQTPSWVLALFSLDGG